MKDLEGENWEYFPLKWGQYQVEEIWEMKENLAGKLLNVI